jgi:hypothetical protein
VQPAEPRNLGRVDSAVAINARTEGISHERQIAEETTRLADETNRLVEATAAVADYTLVLAAATLMLIAIGGGQLIMFYRQWRIMREGASDTATAAMAARTSAEAAKRQAEVSEKMLVATTRPWLGVARVSKPILTEGQPLQVVLSVKNTGQSPAIDVRTVFSGGV